MGSKISVLVIGCGNQPTSKIYQNTEETKDLILRPTDKLNRLFTCIAQYKDTDDTYIHIGLDTADRRIDANEYFQKGYNKQLEDLIIADASREFYSGVEDFVWFNSKYLEK